MNCTEVYPGKEVICLKAPHRGAKVLIIEAHRNPEIIRARLSSEYVNGGEVVEGTLEDFKLCPEAPPPQKIIALNGS